MRKVKPMSPEAMYGKPIAPSSHPRISIPLHALPEAKDWKVGQHYDVSMRLKQTGMNVSKGQGGEHGDAHFDLVGIKPHGKVRVRKAKPSKRYSRVDAENASEDASESGEE